METIAFARGVPAPECLPVEEMADCARAAIERDGKTILSYGPGGGYAPLRAWVAERHGVEPARILLTNGALQGFVLIAQRLAPGRRVLVERPTYDRPLKILHGLGAEIVPLAMDDEGLDPDALEAALKTGPPPAFLYTIPTFQNPTGLSLSNARRSRVAEIAAEHDLFVLEDDPYGLIRFEGETPPSIFDLSGKSIAYTSSFSKTIGPGVRVGWYVLPAALAKELGAPMPIAGHTLADITEAMNRGWSERDSRSVMLLPQERIGVDIAVEKDRIRQVLDRDPAAPTDTRYGTK